MGNDASWRGEGDVWGAGGEVDCGDGGSGVESGWRSRGGCGCWGLGQGGAIGGFLLWELVCLDEFGVTVPFSSACPTAPAVQAATAILPLFKSQSRE